jgi:hypothetical protein
MVTISDADSDYLRSDDIDTHAFIDFVSERIDDPWLRDLLSTTPVTR